MDSSTRRSQVYDVIKSSEKAVSATALAKAFHVSRQLIVGDVALLRAEGYKILATPRGYICDGAETKGLIKTIAVVHKPEEIMDEIYTIIDLGGTIIDVIVEHPIYGQLSAQLHLSNRYDADQFYIKLCEQKAKPLSNLTDGLHLHTISCPNEEVYQRILKALDKKGYLYSK